MTTTPLTEAPRSTGQLDHPLSNALIVVDVQRDFCPGGSLPVARGDEVATRIHDYVRNVGDDYRVIVATKCWHPDDMGFAHFSIDPDYKDTWPRHCVAKSEGARFHPNLKALPDALPIPSTDPEMWIEFDQIFYKGQTDAAYSGFEGTTDPPVFTLEEYLKHHNIGHVDVVGLATDFCVKATAIDSVKLGFTTTVLADKCAAVTSEGGELAFGEMWLTGVTINGKL